MVTAFSEVDAPFEVGTWANFCQGAVSHTFDDNTAGQTDVAQPLFDAKGLHMTMFIVTGWGANWGKLQSAHAKGHEIASHSVTHPQTMPDAECPTSQTTIQQEVPGEPCVTIAYPNCNVPGSRTELARCYIAGRSCNGQIEKKTPDDFYRTAAIMAGSVNINTADGFNSKSNEAASTGGWLIWCHHGVGDDGHGYSNTAVHALSGNLDFLEENRDKLWTETYGNVARYIRERDAVTLAVTTSDERSITLEVTDDLTDSIFNYPLTFRRPLPDGWSKAVVTQNAETVDDTVVTVDGKKYIMFTAVPDGGEVVISSGGTPVRYGSTQGTLDNPVRITLSENQLLISGATTATDGPIAVRFFTLTGTLLSQYHLTKKATDRIPIDKIAATAFIAVVTAGGKLYRSTMVAHIR